MLLPSTHLLVEWLLPLPGLFLKGSLLLALKWQSGSGPVHLQHMLGHHCQTCPCRGLGSEHALRPHSAMATLHDIMAYDVEMLRVAWHGIALH